MDAARKIGGSILAVVIIAGIKLALSSPATSLASGTDWTAAVAEAKAARKPVFLVFGGSW